MVEDRKSSHTATMLALALPQRTGHRVVCARENSKDLCQVSEASHRGRSVAFVDNLECSVVEFDWTRQCVPGRVGPVNHRGRLAVGKKLRSIGRYIVEVHRANRASGLFGLSKVRLMPALILTAGGKSGHDLEVDSLATLFRSPRNMLMGSGSALRAHLASTGRRSSHRLG